MRCSLDGCYITKAAGFVYDTNDDPNKEVMFMLCAKDLRAAATVPGYEAHWFGAPESKIPATWRK